MSPVLVGENACAIAFAVDHDKACAAVVERDPEVERTTGTRAAVRELVVAAAMALADAESAQLDLWERVDWYCAVDAIADAITRGDEPDVLSILGRLERADGGLS